MAGRLRITAGARDDLRELHHFLAEHDLDAAARALAALASAFELIELSPRSSRQARAANNPLLRELVVPFGHAGYVVLFEIEGDGTATVIAVRHQRESDYR